jgi:hypothetical protein
MPWSTFTSKDGIYLVDWDVVGRMLRSYVRSCAVLTHAIVNSEFHWIGPNLHTVDVDWDTVRCQTNSQAESKFAEFYGKAQSNMSAQIAYLAHLIEVTKHNNARFQRMLHDAQQQTMKNIEKSVGRAETGLNVARFTRDASAALLMVSASLVAVPVGIGAVAVGSGLKATARAQDDPKATKSTIAATFATEFAFGVIDLGAEAKIEELAKAAGDAAFKSTASELERKAAEKGMKLGLGILHSVAKTATDPTKAVLEGKSFQDALIKGGLDAAVGTHKEILKWMIDGDERFKMLSAIAETAIDFGADKGADALIEANKEQKYDRKINERPKLVRPVTPAEALFDAVAYDRKLIAQIAIRQIGSSAGLIAKPAISFPRVRQSAGFNR